MPLNIDIQQILLHMLNFAVLFAAVYFLLYNPIKKFMDKRNDTLDEMISSAEDKASSAEKIQQEYSEKLSALENEAEKAKSEIIDKANAEKEKIIANAKKEADAILFQARTKAVNEKNAIIKGAYAEIEEMAKEAAEKVTFASSSEAFDKFIEAE